MSLNENLFPDSDLFFWFQDLSNSISQEGCDKELAVCDKRPVTDIFSHRHLFADKNIKSMVHDLYNSMSDEGCDPPYAVVDFNIYSRLHEYLST
jgi:hypothetical protein